MEKNILKFMDKKKGIDWKVICTGLVCLTGLECFALTKGIDGKLLSTVIAIISLAIGITIPGTKIK